MAGNEFSPSRFAATLYQTRSRHETRGRGRYRLRHRRQGTRARLGQQRRAGVRHRTVGADVRRHVPQRRLHPHQRPRACRRDVGSLRRFRRGTPGALRGGHRRKGPSGAFAAREQLPFPGQPSPHFRRGRHRVVRGAPHPAHREQDGARRAGSRRGVHLHRVASHRAGHPGRGGPAGVHERDHDGRARAAPEAGHHRRRLHRAWSSPPCTPTSDRR